MEVSVNPISNKVMNLLSGISKEDRQNRQIVVRKLMACNEVSSAMTFLRMSDQEYKDFILDTLDEYVLDNFAYNSPIVN